MEEKFAELENLGVFSEYEQIHKEYVSLIGTDASGIEALKRALFIQWCSDSEPGCFKGILRIDPFAKKEYVYYLTRSFLGKAWMMNFAGCFTITFRYPIGHSLLNTTLRICIDF